MKTICLLILSILTEINGVIINGSNQEPVPYAYIQVIGEENSYTIANEQGQFSLFTALEADEITLNIRSVGFFEKQALVNPKESKDLRIQLRERNFELNEVIITNPKSRFRYVGEPLAPTTGFGLSSQDAGAIFITKGKGRLINLHFHYSDSVGFPEAPVLLSVYQLPSNNKIKLWDELILDSLQPILDQPILFDQGRSGWNKLNLEKFDINYEGNVLIHFLAVKNNNDFLWHKEVLFNGRKVKLDYYGPSISYYQKLRSKEMYTLIRPDFNFPVRLRVNPLYRTNRFLYQLAIALEYEEYR
jgi:hypothetical protein